ncbi:hypothetical protein Goshw_014322 [Gossypium schwendimanii]|uniref:Uncharacterized protein n=1 Tax=Gossypium schwendimanii TaxID=34291 RepID=A0A7J9KXJ3_GOSSC|nr:hypothetical protein [Gossypium schwendimanii]
MCGAGQMQVGVADGMCGRGDLKALVSVVKLEGKKLIDIAEVDELIMSVSIEALAMAGVDYNEWGLDIEKWEDDDDSQCPPPHLLAEENEEEPARVVEQDTRIIGTSSPTRRSEDDAGGECKHRRFLRRKSSLAKKMRHSSKSIKVMIKYTIMLLMIVMIALTEMCGEGQMQVGVADGTCGRGDLKALVGPRVKMGRTAAPLYSLSCNENRAKTKKCPFCPVLPNLLQHQGDKTCCFNLLHYDFKKIRFDMIRSTINGLLHYNFREMSSVALVCSSATSKR